MMMTELDKLYIRFLSRGFIMLKLAVDENVYAWIHAETELLHNIPSLIFESNRLRHLYFWEQERMAYIEWAVGQDDEMQDRIRCLYQSVWDEMEPTMAQFQAGGPAHRADPD
jgi:hypothetical protein